MKEETVVHDQTGREIILSDIYDFLTEKIISKWYPLVLDKDSGGYYSNLSNHWEITPLQDKMIVSQARHIWTLSAVAGFLENRETYLKYANHGFEFLKNKMWDQTHGGFYQIRDRDGGFTLTEGWRDEKRAYGNAFGIYSLAALYRETKNPEVLGFAIKAFDWLDSHAHDKINRGYFQFIEQNGNPFDKTSLYKSVASDAVEVGYKDQNSSIHLLEAFTELYQVWQDPILKNRLEMMLELIRDKMVTPKGYLRLFFDNEWTPETRLLHNTQFSKDDYRLDHISFGHDYETAFLMLEASHALNIKNDIKTLTIAKKMVDHSLEVGWDHENGGFYDGSYYFSDDKCTVLKSTKNWWAQAEGLNILMLMSKIFPHEEKYGIYFDKLWNYVKTFLLDQENGDWFEGGIDREPNFKTGPKSHIWKCTYHTSRAMINVISVLAENDDELVKIHPGIPAKKAKTDEFISHWNKVAESL